LDQEKIGKFIGAMRKRQGMTQEQLGEKLGVTNKTISRWETGKYMPDIDKLQDLSSLLGISVNELLAGERIEDTADFKKKADENLVTALSKNSAFCLQDRILYYKRKWIREHRAWIVVWCILLCMLGVLTIWLKKPIAAALLPVGGIIVYGYLRNRMMIYVEERAFASEKSSTEEAQK